VYMIFLRKERKFVSVDVRLSRNIFINEIW
jgi:hypothetical protein